MSDLLKYKQINWIDGMKINKDHFIGQENHFIARLNDINEYNLNPNTFGLLPYKGDSSNFLSVSAVIDSQNFMKVTVNSCHAVTSGGFRIEIGKETEENKDFIVQNVEVLYDTAAKKSDDLFLILVTDPFSRFPEGVADPREYPLRLPYVRPRYELHLIPAEQVIGYDLGPNMLSVGRINLKSNIPELDKTYIPPCASIDSHPRLIEFHAYVDQQVSLMETSIVKIIYDILEKHASNILTEIVIGICESLLTFISTNITRLRWFIKSQPPVYLFEFVVVLARVLRNSFSIRTAEEKETLLNYFSEHFDIVQNRFRKLLDNTIGLEYDHTDLYRSIEKSEDFLNVISVLFSELSKMELIAGKKKVEQRRIDIILR